MEQKIRNEIKRLVLQASKNDLNKDKITNKANLFDDLMFDSISIIELIVLIEDQFEIEFDDDIIVSTFSNIDELTRYVEKLTDKARVII